MSTKKSDFKESLIQSLQASVQSYPNKLALADSLHELTYEELWDAIYVVSQTLKAKGVNEKERVVFVVPNSVDFVILHFAILANAAISVPVDANTIDRNLNVIVEQTEPVFVVIADKIYDRFDTSDYRTELLSEVVSSKNTESNNFNVTDKGFLKKNDNDLAVILYTSGSTGIPKGVKLTNRNTLTTQRNIINFCKYSSLSFEVVTLPLSHSFGLGQLYAMLFMGGGAFLETGMLRMKRILEAIKNYQATGFPTTPLGVDLILEKYADIFSKNSKSLKQMVVNSAPLMPHQTESLRDLMPNLEVFVYYGLTEASRSTFISLTEMGSDYYASVGKSMEDVSIILDQDSEIIISGPTVSNGYWPSDDFPLSEKDQPLLKTGDIGEYDEEGNLFIIGRLKDQINVGGYKVNPLEVESLIKLMPEVENAAVCGVQKDNSSEAIVCFLQSRLETPLSLNEIEKFCREKIEHYKIPTNVILVDKIPEGINGKIDRGALVDLYESNAQKN